ncbi:MAG TPA: 16S rRNA (guanine(966)-N(2))-methyltransferase RsmD [bacterium]|nr:16S rRNA (guanine(966)-N(2))-methyltransferase RsmD [bacterium]
MLRLTCGSLKGKTIECPPGKDIRPTSSKTRQGIFNVLFSMGFNIEGAKVLELFAGTGLISFESISRGAVFSVMVDKSSSSLDVIKRNVQKLNLVGKIKLIKNDAEDFLNTEDIEAFDLIYLDPPYNYDGYVRIISIMASKMSKDTILIAESDNEFLKGNIEGLELIKIKKWGKSFAHFMRRINAG